MKGLTRKGINIMGACARALCAAIALAVVIALVPWGGMRAQAKTLSSIYIKAGGATIGSADIEDSAVNVSKTVILPSNADGTITQGSVIIEFTVDDLYGVRNIGIYSVTGTAVQTSSSSYSVDQSTHKATFSMESGLQKGDGKTSTIVISYETYKNGTAHLNGKLTLTVKTPEASVPVSGVRLNKSSLTLVAGSAETLTATVEPSDATNKTVAWSSSKESVATVNSSGKVTAVSEGTATIIVTTEDGGKTASCAVTVTSPDFTISFDPNNNSERPFNIGQSSDIIYISTDPALPAGYSLKIENVTTGKYINATVAEDNSSVTCDAVDDGTLATSSAADRNSYISFTCSILNNGSVLKSETYRRNYGIKPPFVQNVSFDSDKIVVEEGKTVDVTVKPTPDNAWIEYYSYNILGSDSSIATVEQKSSTKTSVTLKITGSKAGKANIICGCNESNIYDTHQTFTTPSIPITVLKHVPAVPKTCSTDGKKEYWVDGDESNSGTKYYSDNKAENVIDKSSLTIPAGHELAETGEDKAPTCTEEGGVKHYHCSICNKNFKNADGTEEIENVTIPAIGHAWDEGRVEEEATRHKAGKMVYTCTNDSSHTKTEGIPMITDENGYSFVTKDHKYTLRSEKTVEMTVKRSTNDDKTYDNFEELLIDGKVVPESAYSKVPGSVELTLKNTYLDKLSKGTHTVRANFVNGYANSTLKVTGSGSGSTPGTGDDSKANIMVSGVILFVLSLSLVAYSVYGGRKGGSRLAAVLSGANGSDDQPDDFEDIVPEDIDPDDIASR